MLSMHGNSFSNTNFGLVNNALNAGRDPDSDSVSEQVQTGVDAHDDDIQDPLTPPPAITFSTLAEVAAYNSSSALQP